MASMFRDVTATTIEKHGRKTAQKQYRSELRPTTATLGSKAQRDRKGVSELRHVSPLQSNIFDARNYVTGAAIHSLLTSAVVGGHLDFLPRYYGKSTTDGPLQISLEAAALSRFATETGKQEVSDMAETKYRFALIETAKSVQDAANAKSASTIVSVLLLSFCEANSSDVWTSMQAWTKHIHGAYALLTLGDCSLLSKEIGRKLFMLVVSSMTLHSMQQAVPLPDNLNDIFKLIDTQGQVSDPRIQFQPLIEDFINLRIELRQGACHQPRMVVDQAQDLDRRAQLITDEMRQHPDYKFEIRHLENTTCPAHSNRYHHVYASLSALLLWNSLRMLRVLLNEVIYEYSDKLKTTDDTSTASLTLKTTSSEIVTGICVEICGSVPVSSYTTDKQEPNHISMVHFLIWPLFKVATTLHAPAALRKDALSKLDRLGRKYKVQRALLASYQANSGDVNDGWMHVSHMY
ncbi:hypothetical protein PV11_06968 [Exophiala sideris]|uniref:Uncharacterized protein n=1 Tax=Exophiala sideris TaxID=1016849 RepID=A0A0D1WW50_9EURO|nr:hypothetical protein PV11_06968 [Exophiala sideris]